MLHVLLGKTISCIWVFPGRITAWCRVPASNTSNSKGTISGKSRESAGADENLGEEKLLVSTEDGRYWFVPLLAPNTAGLATVSNQQSPRRVDSSLSEERPSSSVSSVRPTASTTGAYNLSRKTDQEQKRERARKLVPVTVINLDSSADEEEELELWNDEDDPVASQPLDEDVSMSMSRSPPAKRTRISPTLPPPLQPESVPGQSTTTRTAATITYGHTEGMVAPVVVTVEEDQHLVFEEAGHGADDTQRRSSVTTMFYIPSASGVGLLIEDGSIWFSTRQKIVQLQLQARQQRQSLKQKLPYQHSLVRHPPAEEALASHFDVWEKIGPDRPISGCCIHNNISSKVNNYVDINIVLVGTRAGKLHAHALRGSTVIWSGLALHDIGQPVQEILVLPESKEKEDEDGEESTGAERSATPPTTGAVALIGQHGKVQIVAWSLLPEKGEVTIKPQGITTVPYTTTLKGACYSDGHCIVLTDQQEVLASPVWADRHDGVNASRGRWSISQEWLCLKTPKLGALSSFATSGWFGLSFRGDLLCYDRSVTRLGVPFDICQTRREISDKLQLMDVTSNAIRTLDKKGQVADREIAKLNRIIHTLQRAAMETGRGSLSSIRSLAVVTGDTGELMHVDISTIVFPPSMVKVVGKKYFMRLRISSMLQMDWNDGWTLAWQFVPLRTACPTCQSLDPPTPSTGFFSMGSSTTLQGLSPGRTIQRDLEVELGSHEGVLLQLPLQFRLGLEYRIPLSSGDRAVYFPIDQVVLDHLHFAEPVVLEESLAPPQPRWSAEMQADTGVGPRHQCTCAHSSSLSKTRGDGHHEDDADGEKEYRWIEQSPDQRLYFLLDAPSLEDNKEEMGHDQTGTATTTTTIGFDNCLSMLLGDYISTPDRLAGMLMSAETAYMMIPSCGGAVAELRPSVESGKEGANSRMDGQQSGMVATKTSATATSSTSVPTSATARIQLALADVNVAANRERGRQWAAIAGDDRMHVCLTVSVAAAADPGVAERIKTHLVDALERRICELMMP